MKRRRLLSGRTLFYGFVSSDGTSDSYIVYAVSPEGQAELYVYDPEEQTFQKYGIISSVTEEMPLRPILTNILNILSG